MKQILSLTAVLVALTACSQITQPSQPEKVNLNKNYKLVDGNDRLAGTVIFKPVGGGEIRDNDGNVIGNIVP